MSARAKFLTREETRAAAAGWALREMKMEVRPDEVVGAVADAFSLSKDALLSAGRTHSVMLPKQIAAYVARDLCGLSYTDLAKELQTGRTDIMRSCQKVAHLLETDARVARIVQRLKGELTALSEAAQ